MQFPLFLGLEICTITNIFKVQAAAVAWIKQAFWDILVSSLSLLKRFFLNYLYVLSLIMNFSRAWPESFATSRMKKPNTQEEGKRGMSRHQDRSCDLALSSLRVPTSCHPITSTKTTTNSYRWKWFTAPLWPSAMLWSLFCSSTTRVRILKFGNMMAGVISIFRGQVLLFWYSRNE